MNGGFRNTVGATDTNAHINEILPGIFIGNESAARSRETLYKYNIGAVVNCTPDVPNTLCSEIEYMRLTVDDSLEQADLIKMARYMPFAVSFIRKNHYLEGKNVLVHCHAGMQRSAIIVAAYLVTYYNTNINQAIQAIVAKRRICFFGGKHINFLQSLQAYARNLGELRRQGSV